MLEWIRFGLTAVLVIIGLFLMATGVIAQFRFKYVLNRMHAAAMGDTMGLLFIVLGLIVASGFTFDSLKLLLLIVMFWMTSPVAGHLIGRLEVTTNPELEKHMTVDTRGDYHKEVA
jgi:multicomponent Na+:H+ antiporter subunit G